MSDLRRLLFANQTRAYTGYPLVISRSVALRYLKQYQIYGNSEQGLPAGYTPLEYIESTGTQYIDTGVVMGGRKLGAEVDFAFTDLTSIPYPTIVGGYGTEGVDTWFWSLYQQKWRIKVNDNAAQGTNADFNKHTFFLNTDKGSGLDDTVLISGSYTIPSSNDVPAYLFARNVNGGIQSSSSSYGKMYSAKFYDNNTLIRNFIPAKRNSDSVIGMYDTVSGQFFTNAGTGTFTAGPVLPTPENPIEVISVGDKTVNLFDKNTVTLDYFYNDSGVYTSNPSTYTSDKIPVIAGTTLTFSRSTAVVGVFLRIHAFDSNDNWISMVAKSESTTSKSTTGTTPANTAYVRVCGGKASTEIDNNIQLEEGSTATSYVSYGYQIPVVAQGKNLFDKSLYDGHGWYYSGGVIADSSNSNATVVMRLTPNKTYYFKHCSVVGGLRVMYTTEENWGIGSSCQWIIGAPETLQPNVVKSFTVPSGAKWVFLLAGRTGDGVTATYQEQLDDYILSEEVLTANTPYAPYGHSTTPIYLNAPLRKVGDYADVLDYKKGQIIRNVGMKVLDGTEDWTKNAPTQNAYFTQISGAFAPDTVYIAPLCSHYPEKPYPVTDMGDFGIKMSKASSKTVVLIKDETKTSLSDFTTYFAQQYAAGTPVIVYYPLETSVTENIVASALPTMAGSTTYTTETVVKPSNMKGVF